MSDEVAKLRVLGASHAERVARPEKPASVPGRDALAGLTETMTDHERRAFRDLDHLRCVRCWQELGPDAAVSEAKPAVIVSLGITLCEAHARSTRDAVWG